MFARHPHLDNGYITGLSKASIIREGKVLKLSNLKLYSSFSLKKYFDSLLHPEFLLLYKSNVYVYEIEDS